MEVYVSINRERISAITENATEVIVFHGGIGYQGENVFGDLDTDSIGITSTVKSFVTRDELIDAFCDWLKSLDSQVMLVMYNVQTNTAFDFRAKLPNNVCRYVYDITQSIDYYSFNSLIFFLIMKLILAYK